MWWDSFGDEVTAVVWGDGGRVHNWRNYVPPRLKKIWHHLSMEAKVVIYIMADEQASDEVWD